MKTRAPQDPPEDTPEALRARSFALIAEAETTPSGPLGMHEEEKTRTLILAGVYASLAQTASREPVRWPILPHPQGAEPHPEDDGPDYEATPDLVPPLELTAQGIMDHPFTPMRVDGVETCRSCSHDRFDHVSEVDEYGNEQPVHIAVPRAVLTGLAQVVEFFIQSDHYTPDGLTAQRDVQEAVRWMRSNV